ncbi:hypothetical protein SAMN05660772_02726 [Pasteurella testudinis DSM 23072]|uniref:Uncharacterized protein n=1 Tax=Pasteurella testudinis DSM 23072 TaxID=1122938 RepID=A0A1W1V218_9PAST|nr:DUF6246 family protein [Pasteurella testudinis]SMB87348.1 hypothetical protein SAMN05660772_02726 [Pasteurella testudinis DSM 23072]SUB51638.1 Uncharacterised protein [Pasteurella testudinis]
MQANLAIGEFSITHGGKDYLFRPSLKNISAIGTPQEIVIAYSVLNGGEIAKLLRDVVELNQWAKQYAAKTALSPVFGRNILMTAVTILTCCCSDDVTAITGYYKPGGKGLLYCPGKLSIKDIITLARHLIDHGIIGTVDLRRDQKDSAKATYTAEFNAEEYISAARCHFGLPRMEAENLTMTEFQMLIKAMYKDSDKKTNGAIFTEDEYDRIMAEFEESQNKISDL